MSSAISVRRVVSRSPRWLRHTARDPFCLYTGSLIPILLAVAVVSAASEVWYTVLCGTGALIAQGLLSRVPRARWRNWQTRWSLLRLGVPVALVSLILYEGGSPSAPVAILYLPIVVGAAVLGWAQAAVIGSGAVLLYTAPVIGELEARDAAAVRGVVLAGVSLLLTIATRRVVSALSRAVRDHRAAVVAERRHARRIRGLEAISRLLATAGPTDEVLERVVAELAGNLGYEHVSVFLKDGDVLRIRAYRGYERVIEEFDASKGVMGRVLRTGESAYIRDVTADRDYVVVEPAMRSLISAPMLADGELLGTLNVESPRTLTRTDHDLLRAVAYRLGAAIVLGRDRQALAERVRVLEELRSFAAAASAASDLGTLCDVIARTAVDILAATRVAVTVRDGGAEIRRVEIRDVARPPGTSAADESEALASPGARPVDVPLLNGADLVGTLSVSHRADDEPSSLGREALSLLASHAALAIANQILYRHTAEQAVRDPLTGLHNRRYFDAAFAQMLPAGRRQLTRVAVILFDLDRFGEFNKRHGHQLGDEVLRAFAGVLRGRLRETDLVARFGGEEFVVVLPGAGTREAQTVADDIRSQFASTIIAAETGAISATVSAGCAEATPGDTVTELLRRADVALQMAKRGGRDQVVAA